MEAQTRGGGGGGGSVCVDQCGVQPAVNHLQVTLIIHFVIQFPWRPREGEEAASTAERTETPPQVTASLLVATHRQI